jgi:hypothetical protein
MKVHLTMKNHFWHLLTITMTYKLWINIFIKEEFTVLKH